MRAYPVLVCRPSTCRSIATLLVFVLYGCATPVQVVERNFRLAQEVSQTCEAVDELFFASPDPNSFAAEIQARLRLRFTGTTCPVVAADRNGGTVSIDKNRCPGFIAFNNHALVGGIQKAANELGVAISADLNTLDQWVGDSLSNSKALGASLDELERAIGSSKETARVRAAISDLKVAHKQLVRLVEGMKTSATDTQTTLDRQVDALNSSAADSAKLVRNIEVALEGFGTKLPAYLAGKCEQRTSCARAVVRQLATLGSNDVDGSVGKSLVSLQDTGRQMAELLSFMGQTVASNPLPRLWAELGPKRTQAAKKALEAVWTSTAEVQHSAGIKSAYGKVTETANKVVGLKSPPPPVHTLKKHEELRRDLDRAQRIVASGLKSYAKLAAGDVSAVAGELFGDYARYAVAEKSLRIAENSLASLDDLRRQFDKQFYSAASIALVWYEDEIQKQFDHLYEYLHKGQLGHPRFELAFASAACRRLDERNAPSSEFAPFLHRSLVNSIPRSLCMTLPENLRTDSGPEYCAKFKDGGTKKFECGDKTSATDWGNCVQDRGAALVKLAQAVRSRQIQDKEDLDDLVVTQICALSADVAGEASGGATKAAVCGSTVANIVHAERENAPQQQNQPSEPRTTPAGAVDTPPRASDVAALGKKDQETRDSLAKDSGTPGSRSREVPASTVAETTRKDAEQMRLVLEAKAAGLEAPSSPSAKIGSISTNGTGSQSAPATTASANVLSQVLPRCADLERRIGSLRCYEQDGQLTTHFRAHFKSREWHDPAIEEVLGAIAELASFNRKNLKAEVAGGASSKRLRCTDIVPSRASAPVPWPIPPEVSVEPSSTATNLVTLIYRSPRTQTNVPLTAAAVDCSSNDGNSILAYFRAAWAASVLERASDGLIQIDRVSTRPFRAALGYDSQWDRTVTVTLRPAMGTP